MIRVLIVDDHDMVRKGVKSWLDAEPDIEVVAEANRGADVAANIHSFKPDVVLLDLHLPDKHGLDVIRELRANGDTTPILVMTGYQKQRAHAVLEAGANGFLIKEEKRERIIEAVRWAALREAGNWISPAMAAELMQTDAAIRNADLTNMELKILGLIERTNIEIAEKLFVTAGTVKNHISNIYIKLATTSRQDAAAWARKHGILETKS